MYKRIFIPLVILVFLVGCDLTTKEVAKDELKGKPIQTYLNGSVKLLYAENDAGMLSLGNELSEELRFIIFRVGVAVFLIGILLYILKGNISEFFERYALILFLSGGFGNLINRIIYNGNVIDFMVFELFGLRTGIFNLADVYIMIGAGVLLVLRLIPERKHTPAV